MPTCAGMNITAMVDDEKFSSGGFRDAFLAAEKGSSKKKWVVKKYNLNALKIISDTLKTSVENHTRKQVQMNSVAHVIARKFLQRSQKNLEGVSHTITSTIPSFMVDLQQ